MRITRVYTRAGDDGETRLGTGARVPKDSLRIEAYGTVDELNSVLGAALAGGLDPAIAAVVRRVQDELFRLGAELCMPAEAGAVAPAGAEAWIAPRHVEALEKEMDACLERLPPLEEFVIPGGAPGAALLHVARTVCRRAERLVVSLGRKESLGPLSIAYLNRLSDWLFVMAREENRARGVPEPQWDKRS